MTARMPPTIRLEPGQVFQIGVDPTKIHLFDVESEKAIL